VSLAAALERVAELQSLLTPAQQAAPVVTTTAQQPTTSAFASALTTATGTPPATAPAAFASLSGLAPAGGTPAGRAALALAQQEVGVAESPPGSNDSPRISEYRQATAGAPGPGPWCAYFVSWAARQAGAPLGDFGQGFGRVDDVWAWAEGAGRTTQQPQPGDLVVWDEHIGIVESVQPDGSISTVEGNSSDAVSERTYGPDHGGAVGFVRIG
jgi:cell wall-associated NlpC family hydrolase